MKVYLRVANVRNSRHSYEERFSLIEDIEEDKKINHKEEEVRYFELKEVK